MTPPAPAPNWRPRRKVIVGVIAGSAVVLIDFVVRQLGGPDQPSEVVGAEVVLASLVLSYLIPEADQVEGV